MKRNHYEHLLLSFKDWIQATEQILPNKLKFACKTCKTYGFIWAYNMTFLSHLTNIERFIFINQIYSIQHIDGTGR